MCALQPAIFILPHLSDVLFADVACLHLYSHVPIQCASSAPLMPVVWHAVPCRDVQGKDLDAGRATPFQQHVGGFRCAL